MRDPSHISHFSSPQNRGKTTSRRRSSIRRSNSLRQLVRLQQIRANRIEVHIITNGLEISVAAAIDDQRLVAATEEMAKELVAAVEARRVSSQKPFHADRQ